ncbi:MAG: cysteine protease [Cyanobacteria bacterium RYN_339]|nr:cysteine protease [Cyanobacteria bacterium RYN_339]
MAKHNALVFGAVALVTLAATGCGRTALTAPATSAHNVSPATVAIQGVARKFGFNIKRYETVIAKRAHITHLSRTAPLRGAVDLRSLCTPIADQGQLGSCTAFAMGKGMREMIANKNGEDKTPVSPMFLYYEERVLEDSIDYDSGATMADGMQVLTDTGVAKEASCPYDIAHFTDKPSAAAYAEAGAMKIHDSTNISGLEDTKTAVNNGQSVAIGFRVYDSFRKIGKDGMMPVPKPGEGVLGGHAVLVVGYDDAKKVLIVRNSWGAKWGDAGYFYMPYEVAGSAQVMDSWTASK